MNKLFIRLIVLLVIAGISSSCTNSDSSDPVVTPPADEEPTFVERTELFTDGPGGNLWKPVSENNGNVVVLFKNTFRTVFSGGCALELADGTFSPMFCGFGGLNCFTNPDRLTMRSNVRCSQVREVKVICQDPTQIVTFTVDPSIRGQICSRHD